MTNSVLDTMRHSRRVDELLLELVIQIQGRITKHDLSKMHKPEVEVFDRITKGFEKVEFGSQEYNDTLIKIKPALDHHYAANRHHPEHFPRGVDDMTLVDIVEMLADWKASTERNARGDLERSLNILKDRFNISDQLVSILWNTAHEAGWIDTNKVIDLR